MKWNHKYGFLGSLLAVIVGTSCCWLTSLGIWLGGASILGSLAMGIESKQTAILSFAAAMAVFLLGGIGSDAERGRCSALILS